MSRRDHIDTIRDRFDIAFNRERKPEMYRSIIYFQQYIRKLEKELTVLGYSKKDIKNLK